MLPLMPAIYSTPRLPPYRCPLFICDKWNYIYIYAYIYIEDRITDACLSHRRAHVCVRLCARACAYGCGRARIRAERCERFPSAWTARGFGSQAFYTSKFNENIGAWNTASVTTLYYVCTAFGPAARHRGGRAQSVLDAARPSCAAASPMRAALLCKHTYIGTWRPRATGDTSHIFNSEAPSISLPNLYIVTWAYL